MNRKLTEHGTLVRSVLTIAVAAVLVAATARVADLEPRVDRAFFFSTGSSVLREADRIDTLFARHSQIVVVAAAPAIAAPGYLARVEALGEELAPLSGVAAVRSLADGPGDVEEARESPLWSRLLLAEHESATHLLLLVDDPWPETLVPAIEDVLERHQRADFALSLAGVPHTVTVMQRKLVRDFSLFSAVAALGFGLGGFALFRSLRIAIGMVASCCAAVAITFLVLQAIGSRLGLLSANLVTIVFVLTQSHLIFLASNWLRAAADGADDAASRRAMRETLVPSLGSMATTLLGFGSLLFVEAKPLRELGMGGVVGGCSAFAAAFLLFPLSLRGPPPGGRDRAGAAGRLRRALLDPGPRTAVGAVACCLALGVGLVGLDTDPSLLAYFDEDGEIHETLEYLDRNTGSAPLELVLRRADGEPVLEAEGGYEALWNVQRRLEREPTVGRVVSLPVVLAEGERFPLSFLLSKNFMLDLLETPLFDRVGQSFVSEDRTHTLFALQMVEGARETTRIEVVETLREVVSSSGFEVPSVGGVFYLQGRLSELVVQSMLQSLAILAILFTAVAWLVTGAFRTACCMVLTLTLVPIGVFGGMGLANVPVDVVTAPAASIGIGLSADVLLHLGVAARRSDAGFGPAAWRGAIDSQWQGILRVSLVVALGFGLFAFSGFPPTRRFGLAVAASILLAALLALRVLPIVSVSGRWIQSRGG